MITTGRERRKDGREGGKERGVLHVFMSCLMGDSFIHAPAHHYPQVFSHFHLVAHAVIPLSFMGEGREGRKRAERACVEIV